MLTDIRADKDQADDGLSSSLLILYLDSARNLPVGAGFWQRLLLGLAMCSVRVAVLSRPCSPREQQWRGIQLHPFMNVVLLSTFLAYPGWSEFTDVF